jgi:hypothetical protein
MVGYRTHEESDYAYLTHEKTFSEQEFKEMIFQSVYEAILEDKKEKYSYLHGYETIHNQTVETMKNKYGFKDLETEQSWTCFGQASIFEYGDWDNSEPIELISFLQSKGFTVQDDDYLKDRDLVVGGERPK